MARFTQKTLVEPMRSLGDSTKIVGAPADAGPQTFQPSLGDPQNAPGTPADAAAKAPEGK